MYYIINENQQILASDNHFLEHCNVSDITALTKAIHLEKILLDIHTETTGEVRLTLQNEHQTSLFSIQTIALSSLIGSLSLIMLNPIKIEETESTPTEEIAIEELIVNKQSNSVPHLITNIEKELVTQEPITFTDHQNIVIDTIEVSQKIGISEKDYHDFFNDYVSTALSLEKDLHKHSDEAQSNAIETLSHLGDVLHLDFMQQNIIRIQNASVEQTPSEVASFYDTLSQITLQPSNNSIISDEVNSKQDKHIDLELENPEVTEELMPTKSVTKDDIFDLDLDILPTLDNATNEDTHISPDDTVKFDLDLPLLKGDTEKASQKEILPSQTPTHLATDKASLSAIDLSRVQPIHFDFSLSDAAEELSLPENLIQEFMFDFIQQAHEETTNMLQAYQNADLNTIHKIAHLLKGVASNLRITLLSEAQYKIQFCNDLQDVESLIKDFWGHFLSFEAQMNASSK